MTEKKYNIRNVKVSVKTSPIALNNVLNLKLEEEKNVKSWNIKNFKNFVVLKHKYTYTIFKTNQNSQNHINITKIPSIKKVKKAVKHLQKYLDFEVISLKVDNIIATLKTGKKIDLVSVCERKLFENMKFNSETFPGLFVKFDKGTAILFHSGNIVLLGLKNKKDLKCLTKNICAVMNIL